MWRCSPNDLRSNRGKRDEPRTTVPDRRFHQCAVSRKPGSGLPAPILHRRRVDAGHCGGNGPFGDGFPAADEPSKVGIRRHLQLALVHTYDGGRSLWARDSGFGRGTLRAYRREGPHPYVSDNERGSLSLTTHQRASLWISPPIRRSYATHREMCWRRSALSRSRSRKQHSGRPHENSCSILLRHRACGR